MGGYVGARAGSLLATTAAEVQDLTATDTTPEVTIVNSTHEDTDGGREGKVTFKGQQSGGEESTLAQIQASHDGTSDDEKGDLIFKTNDGSDGASPTERLRIDSSGDVGINVTPGVKFHVKGDNNQNVMIVDATGTSANYIFDVRDDGTSKLRVNPAGEIQIGGTTNAGFIDFDGSSLQLNTQRNPNTGGFVNTGKAHAGLVLNGSNADSSIRFYTKDSNNATGNERWRITKDGHLKAMSDGLGVDFSASEVSTATSSILDDYEEGKYTPTITCNTAGSFTLNGSHNVLAYTKIGRKVHVQGKIETTSKSGDASGYLKLSIPFTIAQLDDSSGIGVGSIFLYRTGALHTNVTVLAPEGQSFLFFYQNTSGGDVETLDAEDTDGSIEAFISCTFFTAT